MAKHSVADIRSRDFLLLLGAQAAAASFLVLSIANVGRSAQLTQGLAAGLALLLAITGDRLSRWSRTPVAVFVITLVAVAATLVHRWPGPDRWIAIGPLSLYVATVLIPAFLVVCAVSLRTPGTTRALAIAATIGLSVLLAVQPDASQALALLAGVAICLAQSRMNLLKQTVTLGAVAAASAWAFSRPDPLEPVPHVEGVFVLAAAHSPFAGVLVTCSAVVLIGGLGIHAFRRRSWLAAVTAYYAVLFVCSVAGLTPAPLIGYGAGPWLGFGLMAAVSRWAETIERPLDATL